MQEYTIWLPEYHIDQLYPQDARFLTTENVAIANSISHFGL